MVDEHLVGRCGLYCGACGIYRAYRDGGEYLKRLSDRFKCPPEKVRCEGCQVLTPDCWGHDCEIVRCLNNSGYQFCHECPSYEQRSCEKYERLARGYREEDRVDIRGSLERIRSGGLEGWLLESKERFRCPNCGRPLPTGSKRCYHCNREFQMI
jgi:hypothetical protein